MKAEQLRKAILQMAIQGKLVPQDPNDEPASVLLEKIRAEKQRLIKEGKIKKDKVDSVIYKGEDNRHYEKSGNNAPVCIEDELPFEIPDSWEWVRLGYYINLLSGRDLESSQYNNNRAGIPYITGASNFDKGNLIINRWTESPIVLSHIGDLLITCKGTIGEMAYNSFGDLHIARQVMALNSNLNLAYIEIFLKTKIAALQSQAKSMIPRISRTDIENTLLPTPSLEEQKRIVAEIEKYEPLIAEYDKLEQQKSKLEGEIYDKLRKSILQYAIQGKLVPQDENDEPASELLKRIRAEKKAQLGKKYIDSYIYKSDDNRYYEKIASEVKDITEDIPFEIPEKWEWIRLKDIVFNHGQKTPNKQFCYIDIGSIDNRHQKLNSKETIIEANKAPSRARKIVKHGDVLYATVRPYLHNMCIVDRNSSCELIASTGFAVMSCKKDIYNYFLFYYLLSPIFDQFANSSDNSKGVAYPAINDDKLYKAVVPLPPYNEQIRIVKQIQLILSYIEKG